MTFRFLPLIVLLLLAACATQVSIDDIEGDGDFVARDVAPDARPGTAPVATNQRMQPLTTDEEAQAALLVNRLDTSEDQQTRDEVLSELVALGPRYLGFFRSIDRESLMLDMMFVIRRIERENNVAKEQPQPSYVGKGENAEPDITREGQLERPEYKPGTEEYDRESVERFLAERLAQAQRMVDGGNPGGAIKVAEAAVTLMPDTRLRAEFDALILKARGKNQEDLLIAGTMSLSPENNRYSEAEKAAPFEEALQIQCFLKNVSSQPVTLRLYEGEGKESILQLSVTYEQLDFQGNVMSQRGNVRLPINAGEMITLQPNESYSMNVPLEGLASLDSDAPLKYALGKVRIEASLRVYGALDADGRTLVLRPVSFPTRTIMIYPAEYDLEGCAKRPLTAIRKSLDDGKPQDLFMTAYLVDSRSKRSAGDMLLGEEYEESTLAMKRARLKSLNVVFNTGANWDIKQWRNWWRENRLKQ